MGKDEKEKRTRTTAVYSGSDSDGTPWVTFPGSSEPTPVRGSVTSGLSMGDEVEVEVIGGEVSIVGNGSEPSIGKKSVEKAISPIIERIDQTEQVAREATDGVASAQSAAQAATDAATQAAANAQAAIEASDQHFFSDSNGVHVSTEEDAPTGTRNILINSLGVIMRKASNILAQFTEGEVAFYDGGGNSSSNVVAAFGTSGAQIGKSGESHAVLDYHSLQLVDMNGNGYFSVSDLRGTNGIAQIVDTFMGDGTKTSFTLSLTANSSSYTVKVKNEYNQDVTSNYTVSKTTTSVSITSAPAKGYVVTATYNTTDSRAKAYTAGNRYSGSNVGGYSFAAGRNVTASGAYSHAEGEYTNAVGRSSHAEGNETTASGLFGHAEGDNTTANGSTSHAEGCSTTASGRYSHAQNLGTIAASGNQTAIGKYNVADDSDEYALIIGNGTGIADNNRSNALTVDWDGNVECSSFNGVTFDSAGGILSETDTASIPTSTNSNLASIELTAGTWLVNARAQFPSNATGRRAAKLSTTSADSSNLISTDIRNAVSGGTTNIQTERLFALSSQSTVYLVVMQDSGGSLSCTGDIQAVRLAVMNDVPLSTVYTSSSAPTSAQGSDGDVWLVV